MTYLGKYTNTTLRNLLVFLEQQGRYEEIEIKFGLSPYYFEDFGNPPPYHKFNPKYKDKEGREYMMLEEGKVLGVKFPISLNRNKQMVLPTVASNVLLTEIGGGRAFSIRIISANMAESRISTGWVEYEHIQ